MGLVFIVFAIKAFINYNFWDALGYILLYIIVYAIIFGIISLVGYLPVKFSKFFMNKLLVPLREIERLFKNIDWHKFDFSEYTKYSNLAYEKESLSFFCDIDFNALQHTANSPIAQNFFTELIESLNGRRGSIYDLLKIIENKEELFLENAIEKEEIIKTAWFLRIVITLKLHARERCVT